MAEYLMDTTDLTKIASAIRAKGGTSDSLVYPDGFVTAIQAIQAGTELKIVVSVTSGAAVTATKGSLSVSGTSVNGACTLTVPEEGEWTVSATLDGKTSDSNIVNVVSSYDTVLEFVSASTTLNDNSWETIRKISDAGTGANYWSIGDRKAVTLNGTVGALTLSNVTTYVFIIGFNHNASIEGANRIHFQFAKTALTGGTDVALCDSKYPNTGSDAAFRMNTTDTNSGGWNNSYMRKTICPAFKNALPAALKNATKSVTKYTDNTGNSSAASAVTATTDEIFLLAEYEVFGRIYRGNSNESSKQKQYDYYSAGNRKIKYNHSATSTAVVWWLRSPAAEFSGSFTGVGTNGWDYSGSAYVSLGFAPGFCV